MLDQFLVNKNMATGDAPIKADPATAQILKPPAMVTPGDYPKPIPFGGMGKPVNQNGFSDHFPITMTVTEVAGSVSRSRDVVSSFDRPSTAVSTAYPAPPLPPFPHPQSSQVFTWAVMYAQDRYRDRQRRQSSTSSATRSLPKPSDGR